LISTLELYLGNFLTSEIGISMSTFMFYVLGIIAGMISVFYPSINLFLEVCNTFVLLAAPILYMGSARVLSTILLSKVDKSNLESVRRDSMFATWLTLIAGAASWYAGGMFTSIFIAAGVIHVFLLDAYVMAAGDYLLDDSDL
jgi:uncharacterized membrane protein YdcZ (DUF606 family)